MAEKRNTRRLYVATRSGLIAGRSLVAGITIAEEGAAILAKRPDAFRLIVPDFPATAPVLPSPEPVVTKFEPEPEP